ncbi:GDP-L-galactose phosphorylase 2-like [Pyrus ussuriensis x Pyrus communis]|uniref:GDP-L-galactose phosphorylase 2-like n=1 Tax=Pyrus ussuriensis x Pyrus communis TaxID=2448454 RepID=A0A5N5FJZ2_9ROSA|nr:GDP-L-galactose phosphorylase 2-like [Pyrus ussuriensis x Pyrus communis]
MVTVKQLQDGNFTSQFPPFSLQGIKIPLYRFSSNSILDNGCVGGISCVVEEEGGEEGEEQSVLDSILLAQWEDRMWKGLFRYDVTTSEIKVIGGRKKFIAQFNEGWSRDFIPSMGKNKNFCQEDAFKFSWMERQEELLFCVSSGEKSNPELVLSAAVPDCALLIAINASPAEYGHVLLVPHGSKIIHQYLDKRSLELVLRIAVEINNCSFRLFYDYSPSASPLYFQACYLQIPLPVELMHFDTIFGAGKEGMRISCVADYPIKTLVLESNHFNTMMEVLAEICSCLQQKLIPYNLLISDHGKRIFLFFQLHTLEDSCTLSAWECGGYFLFKSRSEFDQATEQALLKQLSTVSLDDKGFQAVKLLCCSIAGKFVC